MDCAACLRETLDKWLKLNPNDAIWVALEIALTNVNRTNFQLDPIVATDDMNGKNVCQWQIIRHILTKHLGITIWWYYTFELK